MKSVNLSRSSNFCGDCQNLLTSLTTVDGKPHWICRRPACSFKTPVDLAGPLFERPTATDRFAVFADNKFLGYDKTAPTAPPGTECINDQCKVENPVIRYFKYDKVNVKYCRACRECGKVWKC